MSDDPRLVTVSYRVDGVNEGHVRLSVFVGRTPGARGHSGQIVLRTDEFRELLFDGDVVMGGGLVVPDGVEERWREVMFGDEAGIRDRPR